MESIRSSTRLVSAHEQTHAHALCWEIFARGATPSMAMKTSFVGFAVFMTWSR